MHAASNLARTDRTRRATTTPPAVAALQQQLADATRQLAHARSLLGEKQRECDELAEALAHQAHRDALTGLFNRRKFDALCNAEIARSARYATPLALIMVDIDHFKSVNDRHGHLVGDDVLVDVARVLAEQVRASDALCRWGGEEFMILAPHVDLNAAVQMAEKLCAVVAAADFGDAGPITCSIGLAALRDRDDVIDLVTRADACLYRAKRSGRNRVVWQFDDAVVAAIAALG
jgi:diguanylate cyclase (GGDEF)-like protein